MHSRIRRLAVAAGLATLLAPAAGAQNLAVYGAAEAAGFGEGSAILGATLTPGMLGWNWLIGANVQTYRFRGAVPRADGSQHFDQRVAFNPNVGVQYRAASGSVSATVGYNFTSGDVAANTQVGAPGGGQNSPVVGAQANYWGGIFEHSGIVSYATEPRYIWSRLRLAARPMPMTPVYLGGELVAQGGSDYGYRIQAGPTLNVHVTPNFHAGVNGGVRWNTFANGGGTGPKSGYVGVSFLALRAFSGRGLAVTRAGPAPPGAGPSCIRGARGRYSSSSPSASSAARLIIDSASAVRSRSVCCSSSRVFCSRSAWA